MEIKPCKKCGGQTYHIIQRGNCFNNFNKGVSVKCPRCGYETSICDDTISAVMEWNWNNTQVLHNGN